MWRRREELEDEELRTLVGCATHSFDASATRRRDEPPDPLRTAFQRDRDRVIHCTAFRRLQHKTQVFAAFEGDHYRTRMTHSLEVSQMARGAARALRLNADLAEAVALGHDLGHPPFGHVGERVLDELMQNEGGFRHNAHGSRIVDYLEDRHRDGLGLNLTQAVRRSLLKGRVPPGFPIAEDLARERSDPAAHPAPSEARVVDLCDRIAYLAHDLDDGLRADVLDLEDVERSLALWQRAGEQARDRQRGSTISELISMLIHDLVQASSNRIDQNLEHPIRHSEATTVDLQTLLEYLGENFYRSRRVLAGMERGQERIRSVFEIYCREPERLTEAHLERVGRDGVPRVVCDYLAGMTDRFLMKLEI